MTSYNLCFKMFISCLEVPSDICFEINWAAVVAGQGTIPDTLLPHTCTHTDIRANTHTHTHTLTLESTTKIRVILQQHIDRQTKPKQCKVMVKIKKIEPFDELKVKLNYIGLVTALMHPLCPLALTNFISSS